MYELPWDRAGKAYIINLIYNWPCFLIDTLLLTKAVFIWSKYKIQNNVILWNIIAISNIGFLFYMCNAVRIYGKKEAGTGEHLNTFNQINKHKWNAAAPRGRLPHTKHKVKSRPGPLSSSNVVTPPFIPSEAPPWDSRPVSGAGVVHYHSLHRPRSVPTALGPAPLVTYPHRPSQAGGYSRDCALHPPSPLSRGEPVRAAAAYLGVRTDEARERRRKDEEWQRRERGERKKKNSVRFPDTLPLGPQPAERFTRGAMRWYWTSLADGPMLIRLLADGGGSSGRGQPAASPPFPAPPQTWRMAAGFGLQANGATPPLPLGRQPPLLDPGARQRVFRPTCSSFAPAPPLRAATGGLRHFLLPDLLSTAIPLSSEGSLTTCPSFLPGFGTNVTLFVYTGRRRREPANI